MSSIVVKVGAQADASFTRVFAPLMEASGRAKARVAADAAATSKAQEREFNRAAARGQAAYKAIEAASAKAANKEAADAQRAAQAKVNAELRAFDAKVKAAQRAQATEKKAAEKAQADMIRLAQQAERESTKIAQREAAQKARLEQQQTRTRQREFDQRLRESKRAREREEREIVRDARRAEKAEARQAERDRVGGIKSRADRIKDVARGSVQNLRAVGGAAANLGKTGFQAAGVNFDLGTLMQRGIDLEALATSTTISAMTGKGKTASATDIGGTLSAIKGAGHASSQDYSSIATGLSDFVSKSGDLETGKAALADLGLIARATGADVSDLVSAAGDVAKTLDDTPDKAERLLAIMRLVAKQGAMGSVEIKDLAKYMGNITSSAFMFEGGIDKNIGILGGLAQIAMKGGATTAAEGTRAASAFSRDITKEAALKRFEGAGIEVFADKDRKKLKSPEEIITQFLEKTGGSLDDLAVLFQNEMSKKVIKGYSQIFEEAGGGAAGIAAVRAKFGQMSSGMTAEQVRDAAGVSMGGKGAQAQEFQNKLEDLGMELAGKLLPALMKLTPMILKAADAFVGVVSWATENPGKAITAAIVASIGKAMIGNAISGALTSMIGGGGGPGGAALAGVGKGGMGVGGALGIAGLVAAAGVTAYDAYGKYKEGDKVGALNAVGNSGFAAGQIGRFGVGAGAGGVGAAGANIGSAIGSAMLTPPPAGGQPAGAPPTLAAPPPNPVPTLQDIAASQKAATSALQEIAKNTAASAAVGPGVNSAARTGPKTK